MALFYAAHAVKIHAKFLCGDNEKRLELHTLDKI